MGTDGDIEKVMGYLGEFEKYQKLQFSLLCLTALTAGLHMTSLVTVASVPPHRCLVPGEIRNETLKWSSDEVRRWIPTKGYGLDNCRMFVPDDAGIATKGMQLCKQWVFDTTYYKSSRAMAWRMVCDRSWMGALAQSAYMLGGLMGAVVLGYFADRIGRKKVLYICSILQLILSVISAFIPEYYSFIIIKYLLGIFASAGVHNAGFVLTMELVGSSKRTACGMSFAAFFTFGMMLVPFWAWLIPNSFYLQIVYGCHSLILIGHWWLIDESPRWLWSQGRRDEAISIVRKAMKMNGDGRVLDEALTPMVARNQLKKEDAALLTLLKTPSFIKRTLNLCFNWFANSLVYNSLSLNTSSLPGNPFLMMFLVSLVDFPSYLVVSYLADRIGRRYTSAGFLSTGGLACFISAFISPLTPSGRISKITIALIGKFLISGSFALIFNYTAELFPTVLRSSALGVTSMGGRASGVLTPFLTLLDSANRKLPMLIFAIIAIISGLLTLLLPETLNHPIPQSIQDAKQFGEGDDACTTCCPRRRKTTRTTQETIPIQEGVQGGN